MFWIPGLSLIIFSLIMIPFIIYGFKKGWVYAFVFSITLWLVTLSFIGINYAIYKYLWEAYSSLILEKNIKIDMNLENLSIFYQTKIVLLATGIEFVFIYPITFLIMYFINKIINKYFGHKIANISKSEKEIVYRRNIKFARVVGTTILTISTLFSASLMSSAVNAITIPYKKSNFANSINDEIGKIYSLGLTHNSESSQIISNFINKELDNELADSMIELVKFSSNETEGDNTFPDLNKIKYLASKWQKFQELFKNDKASEAIFTSIIHQTKKTLNPLSFDDETIEAGRDANNNVVGYKKNRDKNNLDFFKKFVEENKLVNFLKKPIKDILFKRIKNSFLNFEDTIFQRIYDSNESSRNDYIRIKDQRIREAKGLRENIWGVLGYINNRKQIIDWLKQVSGIGKSQGNLNGYEAVGFSIDEVNRIFPSKGSFKDEIIKENRARKIEQEKFNSKIKKDNEYEKYKLIEYTPRKQELDKVQEQYNSEKNALESLNRELSQLEKNLLEMQKSKEVDKSLKASKVLDKNRLVESKKKLSKTIGHLDQKIKKLREEKPQTKEIINEIDKTTTSKKNEDSKLEKLEKSIDEKRSEISFFIDSIEEIETLISNINNLITQKKSEINVKKQDVETNKEKLSKLKKDFKPYEIEELNKRIARNNATSFYLKAKDDYYYQYNYVDKLSKDYTDNINQLKSKNEEIINTKKQIDTLEDKKSKFTFSGTAVTWIHKDDGSIFYYQQFIKYIINKINQLNEINYQKKIRFKIVKNEIINLYRNWLGE